MNPLRLLVNVVRVVWHITAPAKGSDPRYVCAASFTVYGEHGEEPIRYSNAGAVV